ncbi:phage tail protein [Yersinia thracica]|uniref:phage tail-collar fiber domain-containing protein n=1 Tax=Yersinia thracica TaxID=2890319 RepID=UPI00157D293E|nr:phage tail protein [Yersinia thracica]
MRTASSLKPKMQEGSGRTQLIRIIFKVSNTAAVTLQTDPQYLLASENLFDLSNTKAARMNHQLASQTGWIAHYHYDADSLEF